MAINHRSCDNAEQLRISFITGKFGANNVVNSRQVKEVIVLVQEQQQVGIRQAMLLVFNVIAVPHPATKDVLLP
jgi:mannitol/fructose-specific phosphotransferase system IIA component (Ntr-type)